MRRSTNVPLIVSAVVLLGLLGCKPESPAGKATEEAGQAAVDYMKTPMDKARQTEDTLEKAAERTASETNKTSQ